MGNRVSQPFQKHMLKGLEQLKQFEKKTKVRGNTQPDFKADYIIRVIKAWYWQEDRYMDHWNKTVNPERVPGKDRSLTKVEKQIGNRRIFFSTSEAKQWNATGTVLCLTPNGSQI